MTIHYGFPKLFQKLEDEDDHHYSQCMNESNKAGSEPWKSNHNEDYMDVEEDGVKEWDWEKDNMELEDMEEDESEEDESEEDESEWEDDEEEKRRNKWTVMEHKGPIFAPEYERLPENIRFYYEGKEFKLSLPAEEAATFYAKKLNRECTARDIFNKNFMEDWREVMTEGEREIITDIKQCNFREIYTYLRKKKMEMKSNEEKQKLQKQKEAILKEYGYCTIDGRKERIGNFKVEKPGIFIGRGEHPMQGKIKTRIRPEDVIINCSEHFKPEPPPEQEWKEIRHDPKVTWLACWTDIITGHLRYVTLSPSSSQNMKRDFQKFETARRLHKHIENIRENYSEDMKSEDVQMKQRGIAMYLIDQLALRVGNEKDVEVTADTVGCCSLRYEHITLTSERDGKKFLVMFDFLGKDSVRYLNEVSVEEEVFKNLQFLLEDKEDGDVIFDRLNPNDLNKHLKAQMPGLTAKVFRTYRASVTLQEQLDKLTDPNDTFEGKKLAYEEANWAVAKLCNHRRSTPKINTNTIKIHEENIKEAERAVQQAKRNLETAQKAYEKSKGMGEKAEVEKKEKTLWRQEEKLSKLKIEAIHAKEGKEPAPEVSKLYYLDPRITIAWCKKHGIPIEEIFSKTKREKFRWAIDTTEPDFRFDELE
ncbi:unnamed protein product [Darwinula stevensoni]|uniref:DNA topoisomerase I n=1 Tax=Darwinula stevensoni TaxID=69355 RepID=A0A7R8ZZI2_9CRUS|nr:unnamed protein product [Darwinula stevensoni]CAG0882564.1 unnamed protein product [Darwinula stevensoni]